MTWNKDSLPENKTVKKGNIECTISLQENMLTQDLQYDLLF